MASAPQAQPAPVLQGPDAAQQPRPRQAGARAAGRQAPSGSAGQHAIPLTVDEFPQAQRDFPIVFSRRRQPGAAGADGPQRGRQRVLRRRGQARPTTSTSRPMSAAIRSCSPSSTPDAEELSLCFDPTSDLIGEFEDGEPLFDGRPAEPSTPRALLEFCEQFEEAGVRTQAFIDELQEARPADGRRSRDPARTSKPDQPYIYRGFQMVNQEKLRELARRPAAQVEPERPAAADLSRTCSRST